MSCGVTCEMIFDEVEGSFVCEWNPSPPYPKKIFNKIKNEYEPWRNQIIEDWSKRTGKEVVVVTF